MQRQYTGQLLLQLAGLLIKCRILSFDVLCILLQSSPFSS